VKRLLDAAAANYGALGVRQPQRVQQVDDVDG
jgi:hypothetical protein